MWEARHLSILRTPGQKFTLKKEEFRDLKAAKGRIPAFKEALESGLGPSSLEPRQGQVWAESALFAREPKVLQGGLDAPGKFGQGRRRLDPHPEDARTASFGKETITSDFHRELREGPELAERLSD